MYSSKGSHHCVWPGSVPVGEALSALKKAVSALCATMIDATGIDTLPTHGAKVRDGYEFSFHTGDGVHEVNGKGAVEHALHCRLVRPRLDAVDETEVGAGLQLQVQRRMASSNPATAKTSVRALMMKSGSRASRTSAQALTLPAGSSASMTSLPAM